MAKRKPTDDDIGSCWCKKFSTRGTVATGSNCECYFGVDDKPTLLKNIIIFKTRK